MEEINISKLTPRVLSRLAKGLPVKLKDGNDVKVIVDKAEGKKILKSFMKGKGMTKAFTKREIEANTKMGGKGIFGERFDKFLSRLGIKKAAYKIGDVLKPAVKGAVASALTAGAAAAAPLMAETPAAGLIPALPAAVVAGTKLASDFLDKPSDYGVGSGIYAQGGGHYDADGTYHPNKALTSRHNFNKHRALGKGEGLYAQPKAKGRGKKLLDQSFTPKEAIKFFKEDIPNALQGKGRKMPPNFTGGALKRNISHEHELASVGIGGTLLSNFEQHPAQRSQPWSQNFRWSNTFPKYYQQFSNGLQ
jgi:hypothetical protein